VPDSVWPADESVELVDWTVGEALERAAAAVPDRTALSWPDGAGAVRRLTYEQLLRDARARAAALLAEAQPGDRVAVWAPNSGPWVVLELASALAGTVLVPLNPALTDDEAHFVLGSSGAVAAYTVADSRGQPLLARLQGLRARLSRLRHVHDLDAGPLPVDAVLPAVDPDAPFLLQFTSGTTGRPKGALLTHRAALNAGRFSALAMQPTGDDVWCSPLPLHHVGASVCLVLAALSIHAGMVVLPRFDPGVLLDLIEATRATHVGFVPTMCLDLLAHPHRRSADLSSLRTVMIGGTAVPPELIRRIEAELGVRVANGYGQSESPNISQTRLDDSAEDKAESIGRPLPHREARVVEPVTEKIVPFGGVGELLTRSPLTMSGYADAPGGLDAEGWLHTGDLCSMDERGVLRFHGRLRELIIRGGENIYPREIEDALRQLPGVADVAVVGGPDARWGERVVAFVRPEPGAEVTERQLREYARARLAPFKVPVEWHVRDELPLTASGKVRKYLLRDQLAAT
jgi:fatty-acyl-CoA synthase